LASSACFEPRGVHSQDGSKHVVTNLHTMHKTTHRLLRTTAITPSAEHHMH